MKFADDTSLRTSLGPSTHQRLFFLRRLKKVYLFPQILVNFHCAIESILTNCITVWYGNCSVSGSENCLTLHWYSHARHWGCLAQAVSAESVQRCQGPLSHRPQTVCLQDSGLSVPRPVGSRTASFLSSHLAKLCTTMRVWAMKWWKENQINMNKWFGVCVEP